MRRRGDVAVYGIPGIPDIAPQGISGIHGSPYTAFPYRMPV